MWLTLYTEVWDPRTHMFLGLQFKPSGFDAPHLIKSRIFSGLNGSTTKPYKATSPRGWLGTTNMPPDLRPNACRVDFPLGAQLRTPPRSGQSAHPSGVVCFGGYCFVDQKPHCWRFLVFMYCAFTFGHLLSYLVIWSYYVNFKTTKYAWGRPQFFRLANRKTQRNPSIGPP